MTQAKSKKRAISGWIVLNKPYDFTSTQAVGKVRWLLSAAKGGHAGTLDPLATGILPIALGEATKAVPQVQDGTKVYRFTIGWGKATTTDDTEGEVIATSDVRADQAALEAVLPQFTGLIMQRPPIFSAIKVDGERAYDLARAGEEVELAARPIEVDAINIVSHGDSETVLEVTCGKGTYVRSLARDIAEALGTVGHVTTLHRAQVGPFTDADAVTLEELEAAEAGEVRDALLKPVHAALVDVPEIRLDALQATAVQHGNAVLLTGANAPVNMDECWVSFKGKVIATGGVAFGQFQPRRVFNL
ncbi:MULTISPECIES: tRNA pseudouridine(55) synthase TruB [unclassified Devosia]|uniref:tRNA pseudouridine(55) synthase TruB n=1 Tax=unclassified Devosia TaxID=196773 RepID=UPI00145F4E05|nr:MULTISPECIES: tRNA pseudouridine(55) synthase TruB [unclassified Devosia]MBJ6987214.1 tRNA pseudouridine(55) synthase TruB [Devosia sp. MC521]MBJ7577411.1 tRNA pseudouridine(55) synthase TruB [Devosia sp. MC532]QMW62827.1 tRNA pseudouridine(55) synthase TruB [Devosia sp. MC521]